jgi:hypothetical protein
MAIRWAGVVMPSKLGSASPSAVRRIAQFWRAIARSARSLSVVDTDKV